MMVWGPDHAVIPIEAAHAAALLKELPGSALVGIYLYGSAVLGGLRVDSDVDILVIVDKDLPAPIRKILTDRLMLISGAKNSARPLEVTVVNLKDIVPWHFPPKLQYLYGEWLREAFELGDYPQPRIDPDLAILLAQARSNSIALAGPLAENMLAPIPESDIRKAIKESLPELIAHFKGDERNVLLTLARMWVTAATGEIFSKDKAAEWAITRLPTEQASLLESARKAYIGEFEDHWEGIESEVLPLVNVMRKAIEGSLEH